MEKVPDNIDDLSEGDVEKILAKVPGHVMASTAAAVEGLFPTKRADIEFRKLNEIRDLLFLRNGLDETEKNARIARALQLYESLEPQDGAEGALATQMVGTHYAALECLRIANFPDQSFKGREMAFKSAEKMMSLYIKQMTALDKHRGKGQQTVTVKHVNVHSGGQAIVGSVNTNQRASSKEQDAIEHHQHLKIPTTGEKVNSMRGKTKDTT